MVVQPLPFRTIISIDKSNLQPIYEQIANAIIKIIREGSLRRGELLPSSRMLAGLLNVHRKTVLAAYEELSSQDWITSVPRKGMIVSQTLPDFKPLDFSTNTATDAYSQGAPEFSTEKKASSVVAETRHVYRMAVNDGFPDARVAPVDILLRQYSSFLKKSYAQGLFMHGDAAGSLHLRREIAAFLSRTRGINIDYSNVLITRGAQMAIFIAAGMVLTPGSTVIVGEPGYSTANKVFEYLGAKLIKIPVDENGIDVAAIENICKQKKPDLLYIIPHHHHPTTVTLSAERRVKLLELIRTYQLPVIEDDYDYDFHYNKTPLLPLAGADHNGYVRYIGSVTKSFALALRIGYLIAGSDVVRRAAATRELIDIRGDVLMEEALAAMYKNGIMQKHINKAVKLYGSRRDHLCDLLHSELNGMVTFAKPEGGMAVWVKFNKGYDLAKIARKMAHEGIYLNDGSIYNSGSLNYNALRMGFASMNNAEMEELVMALKQNEIEKK